MTNTQTPATTKIDWSAIATNLMNTTIAVIANKIQGVQTPTGTVATGAGVSVTGKGVSLWSSQNLVPAILIGMALIGAVLVFKK
ncbi:MAG: hypothetical protein MUP81_01930 [Dehalococcoidia bacterium]|nr:hypothetical protein [Dehalococcoidia bacterium]